MFGAMVTTAKLSQAAVVAQNLLEMHGASTEIAPIAGQMANKLVQKVFDERPKLFEGKEGRRPHKLSTAAAALAWGVKFMGEHPAAQQAMFLALGTVLLEVSGKPHLYALSSNDHMLLELAQGIYLAEAA